MLLVALSVTSDCSDPVCLSLKSWSEVLSRLARCISDMVFWAFPCAWNVILPFSCQTALCSASRSCVDPVGRLTGRHSACLVFSWYVEAFGENNSTKRNAFGVTSCCKQLRYLYILFNVVLDS